MADKKKMWWENEFLEVKRNKLFIEQRDVSEIAKEYGTPLFLYSKHQMCANLHRLQNIFKKAVPVETRVYYAMKANYHSELLATLKEENIWIEVVI